MSEIKLTNEYGEWTCNGYGLDRAIALFLPATVNELRTELCERSGSDYPNVSTVSEALIMIANMMDSVSEHNLGECPSCAATAKADRRQVAYSGVCGDSWHGPLNPTRTARARLYANPAYTDTEVANMTDEAVLAAVDTN